MLRPQDVIFLAATQQVRPAIEGLLTVLHESARDLRAATSSTCSAACEAAAALARAAWHLQEAACSAAGGIAGLLPSCRASVQQWLRGGGAPLHAHLPVFFTIWLIELLYVAFVLYYMPAAGISISSPTSLIFHALVFLAFASWLRVAGTDPGRVPQAAEWRTFGQPPPGLRAQKRSTHGARWCQREKCYKPDRAHRCRALDRVVLRMDHHCFWLGNTIGFRNHKFFLLFLLYANMACSSLGLSIIQLLVQATLPALTTFLLIGAEGLTILLSGLLGPFFLFHCWMLWRNLTTIEVVETWCARPTSGREAEDADENDSPEPSDAWQYDLGPWRNICSVMGSNPLCWLLPLGGPTGDGLRFSKAGGAELPGKEEGATVSSAAPISSSSSLLAGPGMSPAKRAPVAPCGPSSDESPHPPQPGQTVPPAWHPDDAPGPCCPGTRKPSRWGPGLQADTPASASDGCRRPGPEEADAAPAWDSSPGPGLEVTAPVQLPSTSCGIFCAAGEGSAAQAPEGNAEGTPRPALSTVARDLAMEITEDFSLGCRFLGETFAQAAGEAVFHISALRSSSRPSETKARRSSWQRVARQSLAAAGGRDRGRGSKGASSTVESPFF